MRKFFYPLGFATLLVFFVLLIFYQDDPLVKFDQQMGDLLRGNNFIVAFQVLGSTKFVFIITLLFIIYLWVKSHNYRAMLFVLLTVGVGNALNQLLKRWIQRERPDVLDQLTTYSFPSGHAMVGLLYLLTFAYLITEVLKKKSWKFVVWIAAITLAVLIGLSRIAGERHYATDVLAGWMAGYTWFVVVALWYEYRKTGKFLNG